VALRPRSDGRRKRLPVEGRRGQECLCYQSVPDEYLRKTTKGGPFEAGTAPSARLRWASKAHISRTLVDFTRRTLRNAAPPGTGTLAPRCDPAVTMFPQDSHPERMLGFQRTRAATLHRPRVPSKRMARIGKGAKPLGARFRSNVALRHAQQLETHHEFADRC